MSLILNELRLPALKLVWSNFTKRADKEGWRGARLLTKLAEYETAERDRRRIERRLAAAIGLGLVENGWRILLTRTSDLVQKLQAARRELALEIATAKLDKYHLLIMAIPHM
ncbi:DNA replication protein DnaC [Novosphingobium gossypii]